MWRLSLIAIVVLMAVSCASPTATPTPTPLPTPTFTPNPSLSLVSRETSKAMEDETDTLRQLAFAYWEAFNSYNADKTLSYLEEAYRQERESQIRSDIGRIKTFRVKLGVSEESPPQMAGPDEWEMFLTMKEPLGTRRIRMAFCKVEDEWKIIFAEEVK